MINKIGGRKVFLGMFVLILGLVVDIVVPGGLSTNLLYLLSFVSSAFFLGNAVEHVSEAIKKRKPRQDGIPMENVDATVRALFEQGQATQGTLASLSTSMEALVTTLKNITSRRPA